MKKKMNELIKANRDESVLIKEAAKYCIHVRLTQINVNPRDPQHPAKKDVIQVFSVKEFEQMEAQRYGKHPFIWYRVAGFAEAVVVHDGRLVPEKEKAEESPEDEAIREVVKEEVKKTVRRQKAIKNIKAALNTAK
jgi:hypothetical protein